MTDLDDRLKEHYRAQQLPQSVVEEICSADDSRITTPGFLRPVSELFQSKGLQYALAASLLVVISLGVHGLGMHAERTDRALKEVAMNHSTRFEFEFENNSLAAIDKKMTLLPFDLSLPTPLAEKYQVKGARYCSLSGQLAAHVKLIHRSTNKAISVFVTRAADELNAIDSSREALDGVDVEIWRDSGLLYAMAGSFKSGDN